jgi:hypothetical protein
MIKSLEDGEGHLVEPKDGDEQLVERLMGVRIS